MTKISVVCDKDNDFTRGIKKMILCVIIELLLKC